MRYGSKRQACSPQQSETRTADGRRFATLAGGHHFIWRRLGLVRGGARLATRSASPTCARRCIGRGVRGRILRWRVGRSIGAAVFENAGYRAVDRRRRRAGARRIRVYHLSRNNFSPTHQPTERNLVPVDLCNHRGRDRIIFWRVFVLDDRGERSRRWRAGRCAAPRSTKFVSRRHTCS